MQKLHERMLEDLYDAESDPTECLSNQNDDGSFKNIDYYTDKKDTWHPAKHLDCILIMQAAAYTPDNAYYQNAKVIEGVERAIQFWIEKDFYCDWNGWWNGLGIGSKIADILLFPNEGIDKQDLNRLTDKLYTMTCFDDTRKYNVSEREIDSTGGNLTDTVNHSLKYAVLKNNGNAILFLKRLMENELRPFPSKKLFGHRWDVEGIKADMSFQQHYEMLYFGGYGEVFATGMNKYIKYTSGTQFALSEKALNFYQDFLLDGMQYAMRGQYRDINASGRGIVRENELIGIYQQVKDGCSILLNSGTKLNRENELQELLQNRNTQTDVGAGGHRYFWNSDYQVYNDSEYMASVRSASKRTKNSEALNGENVWGHYLGAGSTMYYVNGDEYFNIFPLWDWNKIPGTTAVQGYLPYGDDRTYSGMGKTSFVGGVSDGKVGMSCLKYKDNGVKAKKAWFMTEDGVMCLGTDISASKKGVLYTTLNQNILRGNIVYSIDGKIYQAAELQQTALFDWIYNNGIGYITDAPLNVNAGERSGDWKKVSERLDSKQHTDSVFELGILHNSKPNNEAYEYFVAMNTTPEELEAYCKTPTVTVLSNNSKCQAVYDIKSESVMAVFWSAGKLNLPDGNILCVNGGCTVMYRQTNDTTIVRVSNPKQNGGRLKVSVNDKTENIKFHKGIYAGDSFEIVL